MIKINLDNIEESKKIFTTLHAGDRVLISGTIFTARDAAHKRLRELFDNNEKLPYSLINRTIYYAGPTETPPGAVVGSIGPTTSQRMDAYAEYMKKFGVIAVIGKGERSEFCREIYQRDKVIYFIATGGCGALLSSAVKSLEVVAFEDLGCESIKKLCVEDFPVTVANDLNGGDIFNG